MSTIAPSAGTSDPPAAGEPLADSSARLAAQAAAGPDGRRSSWIILPGGLLASLLCHAVLILWAVGIFDSARPLAAAPPRAIAVDLVPASETKDRPPAPKPAEPAAQPLPPQFDQLRPSLDQHQARWTPPPPAPTPAADKPLPHEKAAAAARLADALQLPLGPAAAGDTRAAETRARLEHDIISRFKSHLNKCWVPPPPSPDARRVKVLIRVEFNPDGTFIQEPLLIQAVASTAGPALVRSAMQALQRCEPYSFLPRDKFKEWKVLDLAFSPQGIL